jgi:hypothetical protein
MTDVFITEREQRRDRLLRFNGMHRCCKMTWDECAHVFSEENGENLTGEALRKRVKRAVDDVKFVRITEFPKKIVVSAFDLTLSGCIWCAIRKFFTKIRNFCKKDAKTT